MFIDLTVFIYQYFKFTIFVSVFISSLLFDVLDVVGWGADEFEDKY